MNLPLSKTPVISILITTSMMVYLLTLSPAVYLGDSGELSAAAFCLGVPHASGYPLYVLVGKGFCLLPFGDVGFRMNLMAAVFGVMAVGLVGSLIWRMSGSKVGAWVGGGVLAFIPVFWWQTVAAEVYTLHVFLVVWMVWLLWRWEETREFYFLVVFSFVTGLSFGNHLQTVMLAPAVYYLILSGDRKVLVDGKRFLVLSVFFVLPFLVYGYLPIRTWAGAAMHWGDPDSWDRFWVHVSGRAHRSGYVFNLGVWEYVERLKESLAFIWVQFGVLGVLGVWGWWRIRVVRWRVFFLGVVVFDLFYTVFLNTISLEITPFNLSVCVVLAIGVGVGVGEVVRWCEGRAAGVVGVLKVGCGVIPLVFLVLNYRVSDQSENYTAYEHALNIFRTTDSGAVLFVEGDNHFFPVTYGRIVERMREDVTLYDRLNLVFKTPYVGREEGLFHGTWESLRSLLEKEIVTQSKDRVILYAVFDPFTLVVPEEAILVPYGLLHRVMKREGPGAVYRLPGLWNYYSSESFYDNFEKDFMTRQVSGHFFLRYGMYLYSSGNHKRGLRYIREASQLGYDDAGILCGAAIFFSDQGLFDLAQDHLARAPVTRQNVSVIENNWGCLYYKKGDYESAVRAFRKAVERSPESPAYKKNLALALAGAGREEEARQMMQGDLGAPPDQRVPGEDER
jgi:tetratricopeptide (TPR) repeat protein